MARVRKLLITLGCGSALYSSLAPALGLGEITLHSALSQPLNADIELLEVGDLSPGEVKVGLASADEFNRSGVERFFFLNDLRFTPVIRGNKSYIKVVSSKSINEPYLNFLVEVARPNGRLLREYTLLLDPPGSAPLPGTSQSVAAAPGRLSRSTSAPAAAPRKTTASAAPSAAATPPAATEGKRYSVASGDSLWSIAKHLRDAGSTASLNELMQDIHALNPQAFVGNDRARLKVGQSLLLPDNVPAGAAMAGVAGTANSPTGASVKPSSAPASIVPANAPAPVATQAALDAASSELNGAVLENQQLHKALADLQQQVDMLKQQMNSKDQQVAALQSAVGQTPATPPAATAPSAPTTTPAIGAPVNAPSASAPAPSPSNSAASAVTAPAAAPSASTTGTVAPVASSAAPVNGVPAAVTPAVPAAAPATPAPKAMAPAPAPAAENSNGLMIVLSGVLALLVALLGVVFVARRNRREDRLVVIAPVEMELEEDVAAVHVRPSEPVVQPIAQPASPAVAEAAIASAAAVATVAAAAEIDEDLTPQGALEPASATAADALDGASIYIAYGRYNEAFAVLRAAIDKEPERFDLRLRLLDVLGHQNDSVAYAAEEQALLEMGHHEIQLQHLRARFPKLLSADAAAATAVNTPVAAAVVPAQPVAEKAQEPVDNFHLNLDDLSLDADWDNLSPFDATPSNRAKAAEAEAQVVAENSTFHSNLKELPEVFELHDDEFLGEAEAPVASKSEKDLLDDEFLDSFIAEADMFKTGPLEIDFDQLNTQESATKLDLAQAYIEQGDVEGASHLLKEVIIEGDDELKQEARELLSRIA